MAVSLIAGIFIILWILIFFLASVWCAQLALVKGQEFIRQAHWWVKLQWWYGVGFMIFVVASFFVSFVIWLASKLMGV